MSTAVDNINKLTKYLKINVGKVTVDGDNVPTRTTKTTSIRGYAPILKSIAREQVKATDPETIALISQWFDYSAHFVEPAQTDKQHATILLKELNDYLLTRSYLVGFALTLADLSVFLTIAPIVAALSDRAKRQHLNVSRWFDHIQNVTNLRQPSRFFVNFSCLQYDGGNTH